MLDIVIFGNKNKKMLEKSILSIAYQSISIVNHILVFDSVSYEPFDSCYDNLPITFFVNSKFSMKHVIKELKSTYIYFMDAGSVLANPAVFFDLKRIIDKRYSSYWGFYVEDDYGEVKSIINSTYYYYPVVYSKNYLMKKQIISDKNSFFFYINQSIIMEKAFSDTNMKLCIILKKEFDSMCFSYCKALKLLIKEYPNKCNKIVHEVLFLIYLYYLKHHKIKCRQEILSFLDCFHFNPEYLKEQYSDVDPLLLVSAPITFIQFIHLIKENDVC